VPLASPGQAHTTIFGALVLAGPEKDAWRYIGHVRTGFSHETLQASMPSS
jgi:hypothetical protein